MKRRRDDEQTPGQRFGRECGRRALVARNRSQGSLPKCGARRKYDNQPCAQPALENGRCRFHGGLTPRGDQWHVVQPTRDPKMAEAKIRQRERLAKKRAARIAAMTPEQLAAYRRWHETHRPGKAAARASERERRRQDKEIAAMMQRPAPAPKRSREARELADTIERLRAKLANNQDAITHDGGVFG